MKERVEELSNSPNFTSPSSAVQLGKGTVQLSFTFRLFSSNSRKYRVGLLGIGTLLPPVVGPEPESMSLKNRASGSSWVVPVKATSQSNFNLFIYDGELLPESQLLGIIAAQGGSNVIILHHQELAVLIDSGFTKVGVS